MRGNRLSFLVHKTSFVIISLFFWASKTECIKEMVFFEREITCQLLTTAGRTPSSKQQQKQHESSRQLSSHPFTHQHISHRRRWWQRGSHHPGRYAGDGWNGCLWSVDRCSRHVVRNDAIDRDAWQEVSKHHLGSQEETIRHLRYRREVMKTSITHQIPPFDTPIIHIVSTECNTSPSLSVNTCTPVSD